jgi:transcriptional regulator with XRE-family HTH domain
MARRSDYRGPADVARRVRSFRTQAGLTQEELARAAKVTPKFVSQIENGHVNASIGVLSRIVEDGLRMPLALFFGSDPADDVTGDVSIILELLATEPATVRRRAIRLVRAMLGDEEEPKDGHAHRPRRHLDARR